MKTRIWNIAMVVVFASLALLATHAARAQHPAPSPMPNVPLLREGQVFAIARQPDGGIVFGGIFSSVMGVERLNIARLRPDGTLDLEWNPSADGPVEALAVDSSNSVFVGGQFLNIGDKARMHLAKLSGTGRGAADGSWNPSPNNPVAAIAVDSQGSVFVGGDFSQIGNMTRAHLAKLSTTGDGQLVTEWNPSPSNEVFALLLDGAGSLYVGGRISNFGGHVRSVARVSASGTGIVDPAWDPPHFLSIVRALELSGTGHIFIGGEGATSKPIRKFGLAGTGSVDATWDLSADGGIRSIHHDGAGALVVAGRFSTIGGQQRRGIAKVAIGGPGDVSTQWNLGLDGDAYAASIDPSSGIIHLGGSFDEISGQPRLGFGSVDGSGIVGSAIDVERSGLASAIALHPNGAVVIGGSFLKAGLQTRRNLVRLDENGQVDMAWSPSTDSEVRALAIDKAGNVFVGGTFTQIDGVARAGLGKILVSGTGVVDPVWNPSPNNGVTVLALADNHLFASGYFTEIGGLARRLAKINVAGSGEVDATWDPSPNHAVFSMIADGPDSLFVGGAFSSIGNSKIASLARISTNGSGAADPAWTLPVSGFVRAIVLGEDDSMYIGGTNLRVSGEWRRGIAKISRSGNGQIVLDWNPGFVDDVYALALDHNASLFVGGGFTEFNQSPIRFLAKVSAVGSGTLDVGWNQAADGHIFAMTADARGAIYTAGGFKTIGGLRRVGIVAFSEFLFANGFDVSAQ